MTDIFIEGGRTLVDGALVETSLRTAGRDIGALDAEQGRAVLHIDASGLLVLPGIIDLHGDAFERQMMPRPGVDFPTDVALIDSDRQAIANGITTVFHGTTWSWEPGLRSAENARKLLDAIEALRPQLAADTRLHLRHETHNLEAEAEIIQWLGEGRIDLFAFNDHSNVKPKKRNQLAERTGLSVEAVNDMLDRIVARRPEVPASIARLAAAARAADIRMLSHDDNSPAMRQEFRALGAVIAEFPVNEETARDAAAAGDFIVFGAPNVVRGGSHTGWTKASDMIAQGLCSVLASDYYYPAQLLAAFRLADDGILPLARAWDLISSAAARAAGLADRGVLAAGRRADIIVVDDKVPLRPRIVAVIAAGRLVHLADASCLVHSLAPRKTVAAA
ncbi:alpha-D-ribose 1-methylphosphonate 5-triphosphate diphosphatase [Bradyrhizobium brasilense]|uniref:Alpha-D-ribose 1-methylphosphonate 5-triphosphate diphosphatase n=1 Tax=Bradyrhizobium brasilense TaxID=1419277 RepID=A0ABY8J9G2_9BRAD|nr:alpha-D-ribose 1-methylphosphonate 5-triphosphate diphosphatase [Bradyrhizobium brasilense]WFU62199.1 alpha-D-ribose 1-methylphosphonate 5-triphosphate diphosphatase [Bradyrhizobium brasilense]